MACYYFLHVVQRSSTRYFSISSWHQISMYSLHLAEAQTHRTLDVHICVFVEQ